MPEYIHFKNDFKVTDRSFGGPLNTSGFKIIHNTQSIHPSYYMQQEGFGELPGAPLDKYIGRIDYLGDMRYMNSELYTFLMETRLLANADHITSFEPYKRGYSYSARVVPWYDDLLVHRDGDGQFQSDRPIGYSDHPLLNFYRVFSERHMVEYYLNFGSVSNDVQNRVTEFKQKRLINYLAGNKEVETYFMLENMIEWNVRATVIRDYLESDLSVCTASYTSLAGYAGSATLESTLNLRIKYNVNFRPQPTDKFRSFLNIAHNKRLYDNQPETYISSFEEYFGQPQVIDGSNLWRTTSGYDLASTYSQIVDVAQAILGPNPTSADLNKQYVSQTFSIPFRIENVPNGFLRSMVSDSDEENHYDALNMEFYIKPIAKSYANDLYVDSNEMNCIDIIARKLRPSTRLPMHIDYDLDWEYRLGNELPPYDEVNFNISLPWRNERDSSAPSMLPIKIKESGEETGAEYYWGFGSETSEQLSTNTIHDLSTIEPSPTSFQQQTARFRPLFYRNQDIVFDPAAFLDSSFTSCSILYFIKIFGIEFYPKKIMIGEKVEKTNAFEDTSDYESMNAPDSYHGHPIVSANVASAAYILQSNSIKFHHNTFPIADQPIATKLYFKHLNVKRYSVHYINSDKESYSKYGFCLDTDLSGTWKRSVPELYNASSFNFEGERASRSNLYAIHKPYNTIDIHKLQRSNWLPILSIAERGLRGVKNIGRFVNRGWDETKSLACITDRGVDWWRVWNSMLYGKSIIDEDGPVPNPFRISVDAPLILEWVRALRRETPLVTSWISTHTLYDQDGLSALENNTRGYYLPAHPFEYRRTGDGTNPSVNLDRWIPKYKSNVWDYYTANVGLSSIGSSPITNPTVPNPNPVTPITIDNPSSFDSAETIDTSTFKFSYNLESMTIKIEYTLINLKIGRNYTIINNNSGDSQTSSDTNFIADTAEKHINFELNILSYSTDYRIDVFLDMGAFREYTRETRSIGNLDIPSVDTDRDIISIMPSPNPPLHFATQAFTSSLQTFTLQKQLLEIEQQREYDTINNVVMTINNTRTYSSDTIQNIDDNFFDVVFRADLDPDTTYKVSFQLINSYGTSGSSNDISITTPPQSIPTPKFANSQINSQTQKNLINIGALTPSLGAVKPVKSIQIQYKRLEDGINEAFTDIGVGIVTADNLSYLNNLPADLINDDLVLNDINFITTSIFFPSGSFELRARFLSVDNIYGQWSDNISVIVKPFSILSNDDSFTIISSIDQINIIEPVFGITEKCFNVLDVLPLTDDLICVLRNRGNILQVWPTYLQILKQKPDSELDYESILNYNIEGYNPSFFNNFIKVTTEGFIIQLIDNNQEIKSIGINIPATGSVSITEDPVISSVELPDISISRDRALPANKPDNGAYINNNYINSTNKGNFSVNNFFQNESNLIVEQPWQKWLDTGLGEDIIEGNVVFWDDNAFLIEDDDGIAPIDQQKLPQKPSILNVRRIYASENTSYVGYDILEVVLQHNDLYNKRFIDYVIERYDNNTNRWVNQNTDSINIDYNDVNHKATVRFRVLFRYGPSKYRVAARVLDYFNQVVKGDYAEFSKLFTNLLTEDFDGN